MQEGIPGVWEEKWRSDSMRYLGRFNLLEHLFSFEIIYIFRFVLQQHFHLSIARYVWSSLVELQQSRHKVWIISVGPVAFLLLLLLQVEPLVIWSVVIIALCRCGEPFSLHPRWCWPSGPLRHQCRHHSGWQVHLWLSCQNPHLPQRYVTASLPLQLAASRLSGVTYFQLRQEPSPGFCLVTLITRSFERWFTAPRACVVRKYDAGG